MAYDEKLADRTSAFIALTYKKVEANVWHALFYGKR